MADTSELIGIGKHGAARLPSVDVDSYNVELKDEDGFVGDRANKGAFREFLEAWRKPLRKIDDDPLGDRRSTEIEKQKLDEILAGEDTEAAAVVHSAVEDFARELAHVASRFLKTKAWKGTEAIVIGGGLRQSRVGELAIARARIMLRAEGEKVDLTPIHFHPDEAGLIGCVHLAPSWIFEAHDSILAVDIGGTNIRCGVVETRQKKAADLSKAAVWKSRLWRHADDDPDRESAVKKLIAMLRQLIADATEAKLKLAPFIGIACPGLIADDGSIESGAQNLPGNWESSKFNLPAELVGAIPSLGDHDTAVLMHNDAVVQGLSEAPFMRDFRHWGVFTIGTGLGNARFTTRDKAADEKRRER
jgi:hypothetical protein